MSMTEPQRKQLFSVLFVAFGTYFFHCAEAKASTYYSSTQSVEFCTLQDRIENAQLAPSKAVTAKPDITHWILGTHTVSDALGFPETRFSKLEMHKAFHVVAAREFVIRTGLSPPQ